MTQNDLRASDSGDSRQHPSNDLRSTLARFFENERLVVTAVLVIFLSLTVYDFLEDRGEGASAEALFTDVSDVFLPLLLLGYIWRFKPKALFKKSVRLESELKQNQEALALWRARASSYIEGLSKSINQQFDDWQLSKAEKEVALLLLKGFSLREVSNMRSVSERTARQQAGSVYNKAGLSGRAELSAFFLEDLMLIE